MFDINLEILNNYLKTQQQLCIIKSRYTNNRIIGKDIKYVKKRKK